MVGLFASISFYTLREGDNIMKSSLIILSILPVFSWAAWAAVGPSTLPSQGKTRGNVEAALRGEAFAYVKYNLYAAQARKEGYEDIAKAFEKIADQERLEHLAEFAEIYGLVGDTAKNLQSAIRDEGQEVSTVYPGFAAVARAEGATAAAERFEEIARDEQTHVNEFKNLLQSLQAPQN
jgi:rubrerythrin